MSESEKMVLLLFVFQAEDGIRDLVRSRGLGDVYKRQGGIGTHHHDHIGLGDRAEGLRTG